ncbi:MAG: OmpA family protein, partial [Desulfobacteraceae bacterium]|nr:OmpA family protein [Desulfobacteraceae bacterium]
RVIDEKSMEIREYEEKIVFAKSEIERTRQNLEWLSVRIKTMKDFGHIVPQQMLDSLDFKKSKIKALIKLQRRFEDLLRKKKRSSKGHARMKASDNTDDGFSSDIKKSVTRKLKTSQLGDWLELVGDGDHLRLENRLPILFASGSAGVAKEYKQFLKNLAALVKDYDIRIFVEGYADTDPIRSNKYRSNYELGAKRAANVTHELIKNGVKPSVFKIGSTGEYRVAPHKASEWKSLERHVNITIMLKG